jgi:hypothetical protein
VLGLIAVVTASGAEPSGAASNRGSFCLAGQLPGDLDSLFVGEPAGVMGADYQRTTALPDGRVLWTFQDAEVRKTDGSTTLVHNIGMVQDRNCFTILMNGSPESPRPWLFDLQTNPYIRWYWPLGAEMGADGLLHVFVAEMNERMPGAYLGRVEPTATYTAAVDLRTFDVVGSAAPYNSGPALYGWSIESDEHWTYLFAQCHRQFGFDPYIYVFAHDQSCANRVTVGRVPKGQLHQPPSYWNGRSWQGDPGQARPIMPTAGRMVNATQFVRVNNNWMAITKVGDWWGDRILIEHAPRPTGPYTVVANIPATPKCLGACNTYFASWIPSANPSQLVFGLSHNRWDGVASVVYRPTFQAIGAPGYLTLPADRCSLGHCP